MARYCFAYQNSRMRRPSYKCVSTLKEASALKKRFREYGYRVGPLKKKR